MAAGQPSLGERRAHDEEGGWDQAAFMWSEQAIYSSAALVLVAGTLALLTVAIVGFIGHIGTTGSWRRPSG
jgi:hypothetical protein